MPRGGFVQLTKGSVVNYFQDRMGNGPRGTVHRFFFQIDPQGYLIPVVEVNWPDGVEYPSMLRHHEVRVVYIR